MGLCDSITVEKRLKIRNPRLGILFRFLQVGFAVIIVLMAGVAQQYRTETLPVGYGIEMWASSGPSDKMSKMTELHCSDPASYNYEYSANFIYNPTECRRLPTSESYTKAGNNLYFPTYIDEDYVTETDASTCANLFCDASVGEVKTENGAECKCQKHTSFFTRNPEEHIVHINHGFSVDAINAFGRFDKTLKTQTTGGVVEEDFDITTIIIKDGDIKTPCEVGGKSKWSMADSKYGISGSLKEWIACGSADAQDLEVYSEGSKGPGKTDAPRARITGLTMNFKLQYQGPNVHVEDVDGVVCYVTVETIKGFNTRNTVAYTSLPSPRNPNDQIYRSRYASVIGISISSTGVFKFIDFNAVILVVTSSLVLLAMPQTITTLVALYAVGRLSKIYAATATERFGIVDRLHCVCARILGWKKTYDLMTEGSGKLTADDLQKELQTILKDEEGLQPEEIDKMAKIVTLELGKDTGSVTLQSYLEACSQNESVKLKEIATFFDDHAKVPFQEKIFSDFHSRMEQKKRDCVKFDQVAPA